MSDEAPNELFGPIKADWH